MATQAPARKLTTHQQAVLIQVLLAFPEQRVGIQTSPADGDAVAYAQNFLAIFKACGWNVEEKGPTPVDGAEPQGLVIVVSEDHRLPAAADALRDALRIYQIDANTVREPDAKIPPGAFVFRIGSHPQ